MLFNILPQKICNRALAHKNSKKDDVIFHYSLLKNQMFHSVSTTAVFLYKCKEDANKLLTGFFWRCRFIGPSFSRRLACTTCNTERSFVHLDSDAYLEALLFCTTCLFAISLDRKSYPTGSLE